jgi:two-component system, chemotaxis family, sensor kinase CheA
MSDFKGMEEMLQDFLTEAGELLSDVDNKLVELERRPGDVQLLNDIFRGFHTIKGGAGFLNAAALVELCHLTESLFDQLRNQKMKLSAEVMDVILAATGAVRAMFTELHQQRQPAAAAAGLLGNLRAALGESPAAPVVFAAPSPAAPVTAIPEPDWQKLHDALTGATPPAEVAVIAPDTRNGRRASDNPNMDAVKTGRREGDKTALAKDSTIRVDTQRLDQVLNLAGEIGLTKNRLNCLRRLVLQGKRDNETLRSFDVAVGELDHLVSDLQNAVMKTRMQPVGRMFQKYPRMARDLARQLGKQVELEIRGEDTELDRNIIDDLADPLVHLVRNAVDHGIETVEERRAVGKPETCVVRLSAEQVGDHIMIEISDDGRGMRPDVLRRKAVEKGLIDAETANGLDDAHSLQLIFLPGFSTKDQITSISGRGVGMDVVKNNIQKLNGRIEIESVPGAGTTISIALPLTLAILPVLVVRYGTQPFAVPLALVHEIVSLNAVQVQLVSGRATMVIRDEVLPVRSLARLIGWPSAGTPRYGVLIQSGVTRLVLAVDSFVGREDVVIKPLQDVKPKGVAGATLTGDGSVVLVLDIEALIESPHDETRETLLALAA